MDLTFEVLRTGEFTDSSGKQVAFDEQGLQEIADRYQPEQHEAPIVLGHPEIVPKNGDPAYGWVQRLERRGERLIAHAKQVVPELLGMIKAGLYKKVSVGLHKDKTLHHVGLLGAQVPAVKGLAEITFSSTPLGEQIVVDGISTTLNDQTSLDDQAGDNEQDANDSPVSPLAIHTLSAKEGLKTAELHTENEVEVLKRENEKLKEEIHVLTANTTEAKDSKLHQEAAAFHAFVEEAVKAGRVTPAQGKLFKEMTEPLKTSDLLTFSENPGSFFSVARQLVNRNESKLTHPVNFSMKRETSATSHGVARAAIAKKMGM